MSRPATPSSGEGLALITGGAGFVATNVGDRLLSEGTRVRLFDNLSRPGVQRNVRWLKAKHGSQVELQFGDVRDEAALRTALRGVDRVFHFAAQVAVTTSLADPFADFDINARGTLNLLEAIRRLDDRPSLLYTSTNKVYGDIRDVPLTRTGRRYVPDSRAIASHGIGEERALDFHSPYGCSKGAADQYVLDYARTFGLPATVFRMSCVYGPHQFGTEDQGWVAHFAIQALKGRHLTLYGDGLQVRDILFADDLTEAMLRAHQQIDRTAGHAFNIGGGPANTVSLLELLDLLGEIVGERPAVSFQPWRTADQRYYVSDLRRFSTLTGWTPTVAVREGVTRLVAWLRSEAGVSSEELDLDRVAS
jgi:CDP-paratose 2-epimerase